ncbi:SRPBCC family protein [Gordonia jinhuaensis]|uniref:Polyketide cyclase / dehydrase and lipid transport n=1 Tax=Gordonia jinhuaensis TaxID=1517702 RepID=A0A916WTK8_9ACTN|nr:SRPBCC family protein [Gordonia jinhuaensis]GGB28637.1 hypothetical protein GCM10011489_16060 [Gordonia jinhuaensis]
MAKVNATQSEYINAAPDAVLAALEDYKEVRPQILPEQYLDYGVLEGGHGDGTVAVWTLQATSKRSRNVKAHVTVAGNTITETDENSSMVTTYTVTEAGTGTEVTTETSWNGAGGVGGFFEKTFAPLGLKKIQASVLSNLKSRLES